MSLIVDPSMEDLPEPVMVDILSRLPVKKIIQCKCVCKKWLNIVLDSYFADLQLSRSPACFMIKKSINYYMPGILKWVEVEDELNHHNFRHDPIMSLDLNLLPNLIVSDNILPLGSYNGLVYLWQYVRSIDNTYICNPITREYIILPRKQKLYIDRLTMISYCFGVGSLTRKYKVIRIFPKENRLGLTEFYTLGTGQWRSLGHVPNYWFLELSEQILHGHAHWSITDEESNKKICSFNFDNETFELFPSPHSEATNESRILGVLKGCLCQCTTYTTKFTVWVMKDYGVKKSWQKELVIEKGICPNVNKLFLNPTHHVQRLKDGTFFMATSKNSIIVYCPQRKAIVKTELVDGYFIYGLAYRPSFLTLQNFKNENIHVF